jgi:hypothetical protein
MNEPIELGTERTIAGRLRLYYDGYWLKAYDLPADTLAEKKKLIDALTRRLFNHVEYGLNVPGTRLEEARAAYEAETDPQKKRVKSAMLAGALFNRAVDVLKKLVELQAVGASIDSSNPLMRLCGAHLQEALALGKAVRHRNGEECIDELWGEPFKVFAFPVEDYYRSRYVKVALTMRAVDEIIDELCVTFGDSPMFKGVESILRELGEAAKTECETQRTDPEIFDIWASFVVAGERLCAFQPALGSHPTRAEADWGRRGRELLCRGREIIQWIALARVPMQKSTCEYLVACAEHRLNAPAPRSSRARLAALG